MNPFENPIKRIKDRLIKAGATVVPLSKEEIQQLSENVSKEMSK